MNKLTKLIEITCKNIDMKYFIENSLTNEERNEYEKLLLICRGCFKIENCDRLCLNECEKKGQPIDLNHIKLKYIVSLEIVIIDNINQAKIHKIDFGNLNELVNNKTIQSYNIKDIKSASIISKDGSLTEI